MASEGLMRVEISMQVAEGQQIEVIEAGITVVRGIKTAGVHAGLKRKRRDLALIYSESPAVVVGTFTTNQVKAAPVLVTQARVRGRGVARAIVCNSGNANACNGPQGERDALAMGAAVAKELGLAEEDVLVASTGVIGMPLDMDKVRAGIAAAARELARGREAAAAAVEGIMTTDTVPKEVAVRFRIQGRDCYLAGMAKGSGMIHPNMATMLAFMATDCAVDKEALDRLFREVVSRTFNQVSVDGDTSTNDMALLMANGMAGNHPLTAADPEFPVFARALEYAASQLAKAIARDGEGASKLLEVKVEGASSDEAARTIARSIARSNLVKAAVFGEDANWGRILCAAGYAGIPFRPEGVNIYLGDLQVCEHGAALPFDEAVALEVLRQPEVLIRVTMSEGRGEGVAWGCDLTYDYVKINASYRT